MNAKVLGGLLLLSLGMNLFLGGMLVSRLRSQPSHPPQTGGPERMIERMAATLPESDGQTLRSIYQTHQGDIGQLVTELQASRDEVRKAMTASPYEPQALETAFSQQRQRRLAVHAAVQGVLLEATPRLSPEGRRKLSEWRKESR